MWWAAVRITLPSGSATGCALYFPKIKSHYSLCWPQFISDWSKLDTSRTLFPKINLANSMNVPFILVKRCYKFLQNCTVMHFKHEKGQIKRSQMWNVSKWKKYCRLHLYYTLYTSPVALFCGWNTSLDHSTFSITQNYQFWHHLHQRVFQVGLYLETSYPKPLVYRLSSCEVTPYSSNYAGNHIRMEYCLDRLDLMVYW